MTTRQMTFGGSAPKKKAKKKKATTKSSKIAPRSDKYTIKIREHYRRPAK